MSKGAENRKISAKFLLFLIPLLLFPAVGHSSNDEACMECHDDIQTPQDYLNMINKGFKSDFTVDEVLPHADLSCTDCHQDIVLVDGEHDTPAEKVDCGVCHWDISKTYHASLHGQAVSRKDPYAPECWDCHGNHNILTEEHPKSPINVFNIPFTCGQCHKEGAEMGRYHEIGEQNIVQNYSMSIHGVGLLEGGLSVTAVCTSCHTAHNVRAPDDPKSTIYKENVSTTCMQCHGNIEHVHKKVIRGELWEKEPNKIPVCVDCHSPHEIRNVEYDEGFSDSYCLSCHGNPNLSVDMPDGTKRSLYVDKEELVFSTHGRHGVTCIKCHVNVNPDNHPVCKDSGPVDCSICHADEVKDYHESIHGQLVAKGDPDAPTCTHCHGTHDILEHTNTNSPSFSRNVPDLCGECHAKGGVAEKRHPSEKDVDFFSMSVHGKALEEGGLVNSASCVSCHTAHDILPKDDPNSSVNISNINETCGECHVGIVETFSHSIHSPLVAKTDKELPTCISCHKSHSISRVDNPPFREQILEECGDCHKEETETYFETYHGRASLLKGGDIVAKCSDCHGSHDILPTYDPNSRLGRNHIEETCKKCHPNSNHKFTGYLTHATHHDKKKFPALYWAYLFMSGLLIGTLTFFGIHTLSWIPRSFRERLMLKKVDRSCDEQQEQRCVRRFTLFERFLHILVIVSFLTLAVTGMSLKFANQDWAVFISGLLGGFRVMGILHRLAAIVTFGYFALQFILIYKRWKLSGKKLLSFIFDKEGLVPNLRDAQEFFQTIKWFFGLGPKPNYGRWTYWEKFDYLAVFWGVAMIGVSGLMLWFPEFFTKFIPGKWLNVATIIHSDEALLATAFIFTVHFFNTHFRPDRFPMDHVIFTGRVPLDEFKHERPREYDQLVKEKRLDEVLTNPPSKLLLRLSYIVGFTALFIGFTLIALVIYTMLFTYK